MELLVANGTYQHYDFNYRVPGIGKPLNQVIPAGQQVLLQPRDMTDSQVQAVIKQLTRIGGVPASEAGHVNGPRALVFSTRTPVSENAINQARERDEIARQKLADAQVENAGLGAFPSSPEMAHRAVESTLEVRELAPKDREEAVKGGVDTKVTVSKRAGKRVRT